MLSRVVLFTGLLASLAPAAQAAEIDGAQMGAMSTGAAIGGLLGGATLAITGMSSELYADNPAAVAGLLSLGFGGALAGPALGVFVARGEAEPGAWVPALILASLLTPVGAMLAAVVGFPLGTAIFGQTSTGPPFNGTDYAVFTTTVLFSALGGAAAAAGGAAGGYAGGQALFVE